MVMNVVENKELNLPKEKICQLNGKLPYWTYANVERAIQLNFLPQVKEPQYIFLDLPEDVDQKDVFAVIYRLQVRGYYPIVTNLESITFTHQTYQFITKLIKHGIVVHINLLSLAGEFGRKIKHNAMKICKRRMAHIITDLPLENLKGGDEVTEEKFRKFTDASYFQYLQQNLSSIQSGKPFCTQYPRRKGFYNLFSR